MASAVGWHDLADGPRHKMDQAVSLFGSVESIDNPETVNVKMDKGKILSRALIQKLARRLVELLLSVNAGKKIIFQKPHLAFLDGITCAQSHDPGTGILQNKIPCTELQTLLLSLRVIFCRAHHNRKIAVLLPLPIHLQKFITVHHRHHQIQHNQ